MLYQYTPRSSDATTKRSAPWCRKNRCGAHATIALRAIVAQSIGTPIDCAPTKSARFGGGMSAAGVAGLRATGTRTMHMKSAWHYSKMHRIIPKR